MSDEQTPPPEQTPAVPDPIAALQGTINQLQESIAMLAQAQAKPQVAPTTESALQLTPEIDALFKANKGAEAIAKLVDLGVNQKVGEIHKRQQQVLWDERLEREFGEDIKQDPAFANLVRKTFAEITTPDGLAKDHPQAAYRAAQIARATSGKAARVVPGGPAHNGVPPSSTPSGSQQAKYSQEFMDMAKKMKIDPKKFDRVLEIKKTTDQVFKKGNG